MAEFIKVAETADLLPGKAMMVEVAGEEIALFKVNGEYYALSNKCTHREGPLCEGLIEGTSVTCPWHFGKFDLVTGEAIGPPAPSKVRRYEVRLEGGEIQIAIV